MTKRTISSGHLEAELVYGEGPSSSVLLDGARKYDCIVTSPPYFGLRNYCDNEDQTGYNQTLSEYVEDLVHTFSVARASLSDEGTLWLNLGDSYASRSPNRNRVNPSHDVGSKKIPDGFKEKDLIGVPWRVALALQSDGWWLRNDIIWVKPNPMPSSAKDRCTVAHEYIFMFAKQRRYYFDADAIRTPLAESTREDPRMGSTGTGRERYGEEASCPSGFAGANPLGANARTVWKLKPNCFLGEHFAVFPEELPEKCILAGCPEGGTVLDPFSGSGTTGKMALRLGRNYIGIDINEAYLETAMRRVSTTHSDTIKDEDQMELFGLAAE